MESSEKKPRPKTFHQSINKIQQVIKKSLALSDDAHVYLEKLMYQFINSLITPSVPKTLQEAQDQIIRKVPEPLCTGVLEETNYYLTRERGRKKLLMSTDKVHHYIKSQASVIHVEKQVFVFFAAVVEYMLKDILKLTVSYIDNFSVIRQTLTEQDVKIAMFADKVLVNIFQNDEAEDELPIIPVISRANIEDRTYASVARNLLAEEQRYLRDLHLIIKVIMKAFKDRPNLFSEDDINLIFSNIEDIAEMSVKLIAMLDEAFEMVDEGSNSAPLIGNCFEDLAEECSFVLYSDYTIDITDPDWNQNFLEIVENPAVSEALKEVSVGFIDMVIYVLPKLLLAPVYHCFYYFEQLEILLEMAFDPEDEYCYKQVASQITPIRLTLEGRSSSLPRNKGNETSLRLSWKAGFDDMEKIRDIERNIEGWVGKELSQVCNEYVYEGSLMKVARKNQTERKLFLFDTYLVCCKTNQTQWPIPTVNEYRLKEKISLRKAQVSDDERHLLQFSIHDGDSNNTIVFVASTKEEKRAWLSHFFRLQYRSVYDRMLEQIIQQETRKEPLRLPSQDVYRFVEPDIPGVNIVYDAENVNLKGATVPKLVELLTSHEHYAASFTKTFLTTFRVFCLPHRLLDLLIERFRIPEPPPTDKQREALERGEIVAREDLKRFRKEYMKPVQLKVLNVIRQWLEHHWYDFRTIDQSLEPTEASAHLTYSNPNDAKQDEANRKAAEASLAAAAAGGDNTTEEKPKKKEERVKTYYELPQDKDDEVDLLTRVKTFVDELNGNNMRKWVRTINRIVERKSKLKQLGDDEIDYPPAEFEEPSPAVLWHSTQARGKFDFMTLHPVEIARQLTIRDFEIYRKVQCSELVGRTWTKVDKHQRAPHLLKIMHSATRLTHYIMKCVIETENFEERTVVMARIIEILIELEKLNSFNAYAAFACVFSTAAIRRLHFTLKGLPERMHRKYIELSEPSGNRTNMYVRELQSCDPPCVPFYGSFLTHLFKLEEGGGVMMEGTELVNFTKRCMCASLLSDVQQYQLHPYNLEPVDDIQDWISCVEPYGENTTKVFNDILYRKSEELEPKIAERPLRCPRQYTDKDSKTPVSVVSKRNTKTALSRDDSRAHIPNSVEHATTATSTPNLYSTTAAKEENDKKNSDCPTTEVESGELPPTLPPREPTETPPPIPPRDVELFGEQHMFDRVSPSSAFPHHVFFGSVFDFNPVAASPHSMSMQRVVSTSAIPVAISTTPGVVAHAISTPMIPQAVMNSVVVGRQQQNSGLQHAASTSAIPHAVQMQAAAASSTPPPTSPCVAPTPHATNSCEQQECEELPPPVPPRDDLPPQIPPRDDIPPPIPRRPPSDD